MLVYGSSVYELNLLLFTIILLFWDSILKFLGITCEAFFPVHKYVSGGIRIS